MNIQVAEHFINLDDLENEIHYRAKLLKENSFEPRSASHRILEYEIYRLEQQHKKIENICKKNSHRKF